jgi:RNA polymerase sigma factor (sigma-70 family)
MLSENERFRNTLQSNPSEAISFLYDKYYKSLLRYAFMITKDEESSKDIVQEAILYIWTNRKEFGRIHKKSIQYYLIKIVQSKSLSYFRKAAHLDVDQLHPSIHPVDYTTIEVETVEAEILQQIRDVISTFPKRERECLMMKIDHGMTPGDIAARLNVTEKAVQRAITSASKRLRRWANTNGFP